MKIQVNNKVYFIDFDYSDSFTTRCIIWEQLNTSPASVTTVAVGGSIRVPNDTHVKEIGRKIAFSRAIKDFDRATRTQFWSEYFKRKNYRKEYSYREVKRMIESLEDCHTIEHVRDTILSIKSLYGIKTEE